jgi:hypothetical protein
MKKKLTLGLFGFALSTMALLSSAPSAESQQRACTLFCIRDYHCCLTATGQTCVPNSQPCKS